MNVADDKVWLNVHEQLKELNEIGIPSSQSVIEWVDSEDDESKNQKSNCLLLVRQHGKLKNSNRKPDISKITAPCFSPPKITTLKNNQLMKSLTNQHKYILGTNNLRNVNNSDSPIDDKSFSNVSSLDDSIINIKKNQVDSACQLKKAENVNINTPIPSSPILGTRRKPKCSKSMRDFHSHLGQNKLDQSLLKTSQSEKIIKLGNSPTLSYGSKFRMKINPTEFTNVNKGNDSDNDDNVTFHKIRKRNLTSSFAKCSTFQSRSEMWSKESHHASDEPVLHEQNEDFNNLNLQCEIRSFTPSSTVDSQQKELGYSIDTCPSPIFKSTLGVHFKSDSTTPTVLSQSSHNSSIPNMMDIKKGSDWLKDVQNKTPEKQIISSKKEYVLNEPPDSSKKKRKKNGHAEHLQKLIQIWQSDVSMWRHQMSLAAKLDIKCSNSSQENSPLYNNSKILHNVQQVIESPNNVLGSKRRSSPSLIARRDLLPVLTSEGNTLKMNVDAQCRQYSDINQGLKSDLKSTYYSPKGSVSNLIKNSKDSLEISPLSSCGLSSKGSFSINRKHICLQVIEICMETSLRVVCFEIDKCYQPSPETELNVRKGSNFHLEENTLENLETSNANKDCNSHTNNLNVETSKSKKFLVILGHLENKPQIHLEVGDCIKIFAPWQILEDANLSLSTLFTSYYLIKKKKIGFREEFFKENRRKMQLEKKFRIASWSCSCLSGPHIMPNICFGGMLKKSKVINEVTVRETLQQNQSFNAVKNTSVGIKNDKIWTVLEAIEKCGGLPDIPVSVTMRILRILTMKGNASDTAAEDNFSHYLLLGQDPSGAFFVVEIPNRPLKSTLKTLLDDGEETTQTLTYLTVTQRITHNQNPAMFSLIKSLHKSYQKEINNNEHLLLLLKDHSIKPPQTYCYNFIVTLGQTKNILVAEREGVIIKLPKWTIEEAIKKEEQGHRGIIYVNIFYYLHPHLHVTCRKNLNPTKLQRISVVSSSQFPTWMNCDGTIIVSAMIRDVLISRDGLAIDEYSQIQRINGNFEIMLQDILKLLTPFSPIAVPQDLVVIEGFIKAINEKDSYYWEECNICNSQDLHYASPLNAVCNACHSQSISPLTKYVLEVSVEVAHCEDSFLNSIMVKLFQITIEKLLKSSSTSKHGYNAESLLNAAIGPLICLVKSVKTENGLKTFRLSELPH